MSRDRKPELIAEVLRRTQAKSWGDAERHSAPAIQRGLKALEGLHGAVDEQRQAFSRAVRTATSRRVEVIRQSGLLFSDPDDLHRVVEDRLEESPYLDAVRDWLDTVDQAAAPPVLMLLGGTGGGKTLAAAHALLHSEHWSVVAARPNDIARWLHPSRFNDDPMVNRLRHSSLLVMDDLGTEAVDHFAAAFSELLEWRLGARGQWTVITSNLTPKQIAERYDARVIDRLDHTAAIVQAPAKSMRQRRAGLRTAVERGKQSGKRLRALETGTDHQERPGAAGGNRG